MTASDIVSIRSDPRRWFGGFGRFRDEQTRQPTRAVGSTAPNILQRRIFEHYRRCQEANKPCRMVVVKYRRAGSSTACSACIYLHAHNYRARLGVIGTDYKASTNMLEMISFFGEHDDFPGWAISEDAEFTAAKPVLGETRKVPWQEWESVPMASVPWEERIERQIATRIDFGHDSRVELYTAKNPESARSAGLNGYHATEIGRWPVEGAQSGGETITAMRNTLPKDGFHVAIEESTAHGAQGVFYETCRSARWPEYAEWSKQWETVWPLEEAAFGKDLQFVLIFAAWFEDRRNVYKEDLSEEALLKLKSTLDEDEKQLISRYGNEGPQGLRLGKEVDTTVWQQLAWRRAIIRNVCTKGGADEFRVEYPANPSECFRASGSPALDMEGLLVLEAMARESHPEYGQLVRQKNGAVLWSTTAEQQAVVHRWEEPFEGGRYIISCDPMSGADMVTGPGEKDRHGVLVLRDAYKDQRGKYWPTKVVMRGRPPCQLEDQVLTNLLVEVGDYYGKATIVVESNCGIAILKRLLEDYRYPNIYQRPELDSVTQKTTTKLGWRTDTASRRVVIATLQRYVREQMLDLLCRHVVGELMTLVIDKKGKVRASGKNHDDDAMALAIGLECLPAAHEYPRRGRVHRDDPNAREWR